ncbi:peptidoglycan editing factor PgeF [Fodinibius sp. AD559]|uniref:peptidoglycan editing factor PgeF n=1 Tax=Fodinibius sp. AD559 TaxID=3424179 RepID=UPI004046BD51
MKSLKTDFSVIVPQILRKNKGIRAWFTLKNQEFQRPGQAIAGLNVGFNTPEKKEQVARNRLALLNSLSIDPDRVAYADQVHSNRVQFVTDGGTYPSTDGLVTKVPGLTLAIQVADCAAILLWDAKNNVIAALHAGWRGAVGDIILRGVQKMKEQGAEASKIKSFVSPCISPKNFEVGIEVAEQFPDQFVNYADFEKPHVDLKSFIKHQLLDEGIPNNQIEIREECTISEAEKFYSHRREGNKSGRMLALIQITE